jgi:hypothetical protein
MYGCVLIQGKITKYTWERTESMAVQLRLKEVQVISLYTVILDNGFYDVLLLFEEKESLGILGKDYFSQATEVRYIS